jgi:2,4-didehydro-3-deoxy-L-rhamnonate hydrolase
VDAPTTVIEAGGALYALPALIDAAGAAAPSGGRDVFSILGQWDAWLPVLGRLAAGAAGSGVPAEQDVDWLPPVVFPRKLICIGANYSDHLEEMGADISNKAPYAFLKPASTGLIGSGQPVHLPPKATWIDWEAEIAIVIGKHLRNVTGDAVFDAVAGYTALNDISNRDGMESWQPIIGMDWIIHKGYDGFAPAGPLVTPAQFVGDVQDIDLQLTVNGVVKQSSNTSRMIFGMQEILEHLCSVMTLEPGDIIATGTPEGVGYGRNPKETLHDGDEVVVTVEHLGSALVSPIIGRGKGA